MLTLTLLATLLATPLSSLALALPQSSSTPAPTTGNLPTLPYATNTTLTYYQGTTSPSSCGVAVGTGTLQANVCNKITVQGWGIREVPAGQGSCSFTLWKGSESCDGGEGEVVEIPSGNGTVCVVTGVLDGGMHYKGSGVWTCG